MDNKKKSPLVSIIVPVYNAQTYLEKCVDSLLNQTYQQLEIILINDGSTDQSLHICEKYKKSHRNIVIVSKTNAGASAARNTGIEQASGEWVTFVDADDWIEMNFVEALLEFATLHHLKLVSAGYCTVRDSDKKNILYKGGSQQITFQKSLLLITSDKEQFPKPMWGKLYKRELLNDIRFREGLHYGEDKLFVVETLLANKADMGYVHEPLYNYRLREGSMMRSFSYKTYDAITALEEIAALIERESSRAQVSALAHVVVVGGSLLMKILSSSEKTQYSDLHRKIRKKMMTYVWYLIITRDVSLNRKMKSVVALFFPYFTSYVYRIKK